MPSELSISMAYDSDFNNHQPVSDNLSKIDLNLGDENAAANNSAINEESNIINGDEPYVGQEFESEEAAHAFYASYGTRIGFMTRMSSITRRDGFVVRRTLVCNKEGYYTNRCGKEKRRPRTLTRVGCKANIVIGKLSNRIWVVKKIVKEHNHPLAERHTPIGADTDPSLSESNRIQELTTQLLRERKRSASLRKIIDLLFNHIKEHTEDLAETAQSIGDKINEIDSLGKTEKKILR